jgi:hypothetical protein
MRSSQRPYGTPAPLSATPRGLVWGVTVAAFYIAVAAVGWPFPVRLLYDGLVPLPPYRWVHPPADRAKDNDMALSGSGTLVLGPQGSRAAEISTGDDQALITFPEAAVASRPGESSVKVTLIPLDPATVGPTPEGGHFDGNAYRVSASYASSGAPVAIAAPVTVVLRYAIHATQVLRFEKGGGWGALQTIKFDGSQQVLANSDGLGVFVPAGPGRALLPGRPFRLTASRVLGVEARWLGRPRGDIITGRRHGRAQEDTRNSLPSL